MKSLTIIFLVFNLFRKDTCPTIRLEDPLKSVTYNEAVISFLRSEKIVMAHRKRNFIKSDPITEYKFWLKTFTKYSPEMLKKTNLYSVHLIKMLTDKSIKKDNVFNRDVIMLLYNLCVEEYSVVLQSLYKNYRENTLDFSILSLAIDQDITFNNLVAAKYKNQRIRSILTEIMWDKKLSTLENGIDLKNRIKDILSGKVWTEEAQEMEIIQPPIMNSKECDVK